MTMNFDTYTMIADLLFEREDLTIEEIAEECGVSVEAVQYVDRSENDIF